MRGGRGGTCSSLTSADCALLAHFLSRLDVTSRPGLASPPHESGLDFKRCRNCPRSCAAAAKTEFCTTARAESHTCCLCLAHADTETRTGPRTPAERPWVRLKFPAVFPRKFQGYSWQQTHDKSWHDQTVKTDERARTHGHTRAHTHGHTVAGTGDQSIFLVMAS